MFSGDDEEDVALEEAAAQARKERAIAASAYGHRASGAAGDLMTVSVNVLPGCVAQLCIQAAAVVSLTSSRSHYDWVSSPLAGQLPQ